MQVYLSACVRRVCFRVGECELNSLNRSGLLSVSSDVIVKHLVGFSVMITTAFVNRCASPWLVTQSLSVLELRLQFGSRSLM